MSSISWPAFLVGLTLGFYWARVIRLVLKAKSRGTSANFFPPEATGRALRAVWYPTVVAWIALPLFLAFHWPTETLYLPLFRSAIVAWLAAVACVAVLAVTMVCWRKMGREWRMGIDPNERNNLLVTGPYAFVRHPIYALQQALAIASAIAVPAPLMIAITALEIAMLTWEAAREETHLARVHGQTYFDYMRVTGRFLPRLKRAAKR